MLLLRWWYFENPIDDEVWVAFCRRLLRLLLVILLEDLPDTRGLPAHAEYGLYV